MAISVPHQDAEAYLHLPIVNSKMDRFSLLNNLSSATTFAKSNLTKGRTLLICCRDGEDISVCVCLAILISLFDDEASQSSASHPMLGSFDGGESFSETEEYVVVMGLELMSQCLNFMLPQRIGKVNYNYKQVETIKIMVQAQLLDTSVTAFGSLIKSSASM
ncbi:hypothetical protein V6N13_144773 [Hibiscus sabdariffa]